MSETSVVDRFLAPPLTERSRRRESFTEGTPVLLCNGEEWHLPDPRPEDFRFVYKDGKPQLAKGFSLGAEYERLLDNYVESETASEEAVCLFLLAGFLLLRNYDLSREDLVTLLRRGGAGEAGEKNVESWKTIGEVAIGTAPKPTAVGSGSPSPPTDSTPTA